MKQGIVGGLLVVVGVIFSPFGPHVLGWGKELSFAILSTIFSVGSYLWTLWTHGGSNVVLLSLLVTLWAILLFYVVIAMIAALVLAVNAVRVFVLDQTKNACVNFGGIVSNLRYSCGTFFFCVLSLYFARLVDTGVGVWTTESSIFAESTYESLFYWGVRGYLYIYPLLMVAAGLFILKESCRKWGQNMLRG